MLLFKQNATFSKSTSQKRAQTVIMTSKYIVLVHANKQFAFRTLQLFIGSHPSTSLMLGTQILCQLEWIYSFKTNTERW